MKKTILVGIWDANNLDIKTTYLYHGISRKQAIINFIHQYFNNDYNTMSYEKELSGIYKSNCIKDRLLYDYTEDIIIYSQYA